MLVSDHQHRPHTVPLLRMLLVPQNPCRPWRRVRMRCESRGCHPHTLAVPSHTIRCIPGSLGMGGEWSQRVEAGSAGADGAGLSGAAGGSGETWREVRGLRERTVYEFWVRAATAAGAGASSRLVAAAPAAPVGARVSSVGRRVVASAGGGGGVLLRCAAVGAPPLRRRWLPLPPHHTITEAGDLLIHKVDAQSAGNYTCSVRNALGTDSAVFSVVVQLAPAAPVLRLARASAHELHFSWEPPADGGAPILGYTLWWSGEGTESIGSGPRGRSISIPGSETSFTLSGLRCGAQYAARLDAHNAVGASPPSHPILARTRGDKARAAPGKEAAWANATCVRVLLLAWRARCPVTAWSIALRVAASADAARLPAWVDLPTDGEVAEANDLQPGTWYEVRVMARSPAGDTTALYRVATYTVNGERVGETVEVPLESPSTADGAVGVGAGADGAGSEWRGGLAAVLLGAGLAALLVSLAGAALARRRYSGACAQRECALAARAQPQLYSTEPAKRAAKPLLAADGDLHEISPYATFSMSECGSVGPGGGLPGSGVGTGTGTGSRRGCALHLRTFGRAEPLDLAAPPPRPNLLHATADYGGAHESDSESSGSPCAACAAELYRLPAAHLSDTLPAVESSTEDTSYSVEGRVGRVPRSACSERTPRGERGKRDVVDRGARSERAERSERGEARPRRRRDHPRHSAGPTVRYFPASALQPRQEAL